ILYEYFDDGNSTCHKLMGKLGGVGGGGGGSDGGRQDILLHSTKVHLHQCTSTTCILQFIRVLVRATHLYIVVYLPASGERYEWQRKHRYVLELAIDIALFRIVTAYRWLEVA